MRYFLRMKLPPFLTTVTSFSKILAAVLFVSLPIAGFILGMEYQKGITPLIVNNNNSQVPIAKITSQTIDLTANWKTYADDINGFSLKYPHAWNKGDEKGKDGNIVVLTSAPIEQIGQQVQAVYIQVHENPKRLTSMAYYDQFLKPGQAGSVCTNPLINTNVPSSLKNEDATIIEGMCGVLSQGPRMVVTRDNYIVDISSSFVDDVESNLIYQILSTFKFLDQNTTSDDKLLNQTLCENCPLYTLPDPNLCKEGETAKGDPISYPEKACYCPKCVNSASVR